MAAAVRPKSDHQVRVSPPQRNVLVLLRDGWECSRCGGEPGPFHKLIFYGFHRGAETRWASGTTLGSLERRGFIAWETTTLTLVYDRSQVPGVTLALTSEGKALVPEAEEERHGRIVQ